LLGFVDDGPAAVSLAEMLSLVRATFGESADGCAVVPQGGMLPVAPEDLPVLIDAEGEFAAAFAAKRGTAWLVRPDGYIGWCSAAPSAAGLQSFLKVMVQTLATSV
jgi:alkanesulfonate monooxygenase SsuD/methylene tetrahydromethanopterin reductase-like flavin-dependent oxidoreductase (luciferase family)